MTKRNTLWIWSFMFCMLIVLIITDCKKNEDWPTVSTAKVTKITDTTAVCGGEITYEGGSDVTLRGICWGTSDEPTTKDEKEISGVGMGSFTCSLKGLTPNTTYYVRSFATNEFGTSYGKSVSFKTLEKIIPLADIDGNIYHTIIAGGKEWMIENLKSTRFNDGETITYVTDAASWSSVFAPAYCWYNNDTSNKHNYGALYNWYAVTSGKLCPDGWHVAADNEWYLLINTFGGSASAGMKLKDSTTVLWNPPNAGANNESGFTAYPGGMRESDGIYYFQGQKGYWWTSTSASTYSAWYREMRYNCDSVCRLSNDMEAGYSVRCIKD